ncbi:hypothetical protein AA101099_0277 [Neoasaia chiangmaiensis NBRC 101099]|uniref:Cys-tRNA(Pro)/Cys-tRNA(Cys) deacylase n=1 Tax=Neoasaia chiangmaiensis TaxID=320497 RepID=A0A1U9KRS4_9PROT|nr:Cys-tRNA(Pro) deacylase [Neoasaia chiangmaiensis]AQS88584.1 aminoacyl-tRNA deacylase [Neoasaia chiangmaiensis]GBR36216.1 hypothetical protein AA101099_0277 [Neoasaia chiangmaiensis NBRC 101099]GEN15429.1 Cys-tRNA(Pro)/Cys-tRNA(Cys) deacylase [Neoasaia chiangmaiensis]
MSKKPVSGATPATSLLDQAGLAYTLHAHEYDADASAKGLQAAEALGAPPEQVFKTLMVLIDKTRPACLIVPSNKRLALKKVAALQGGKSASMMAPADAERLTGYKTGGISPFGQRKTSPIMLDASALEHETIYVNGGRRGLQCQIAPQAAARHFGWTVDSIAE